MTVRRLCLGSGNAPEKGPEWTNIDCEDFGNNIVHDLNIIPWPFDDDTFVEVRAVDVLEHLDKLVPPFNEIIRDYETGRKSIDTRAEWKIS